MAISMGWLVGTGTSTACPAPRAISAVLPGPPLTDTVTVFEGKGAAGAGRGGWGGVGGARSGGATGGRGGGAAGGIDWAVVPAGVRGQRALLPWGAAAPAGAGAPARGRAGAGRCTEGAARRSATATG